MVKVRPVVLGVVLVAAITGCGESNPNGPGTASSPTVPPTDAEDVAPTSAATVPEGERPPAATKQELAKRLDKLDSPQLRQSVEDGQDWNGQLVGWLFNNLTEPDIWLLCNSIDESHPPGCGTGVELTKEPAILTQQPERFETLTVDGLPAVVMSRSFVAVTGTFLHDSAMFVPTEST